MKIIYVLIVVAHVYAGKVVTFQEFNSIDSCNEAKKFATSYTLWGDAPTQAICIKKG